MIGRGFYFVHSLFHPAHGTVALVGRIFGFLRQNFRLIGVFGVLLGHAGHLFQTAGYFLKRTGLFRGTLGEALAAVADLTARGRDLIDRPSNVGEVSSRETRCGVGLLRPAGAAETAKTGEDKPVRKIGKDHGRLNHRGNDQRDAL